MNILFIAYGIYEYDGRLRELIRVSKMIGKTTYITRVNSYNSIIEKTHMVLKETKIFGYIKYIIKTIIISNSMKNIDILFIGDRRAILPGMIIKKIYSPQIVILDVRELYLINEVKTIKSKIGCLLENLSIKRADIVICANKYRAKIMKRYYSLNSLPLIYENIRKLNFNKNHPIEVIGNKFSQLFNNKNTFKIISTSGYSIQRGTDKLTMAMKKLGKNYELFLVGGGSNLDHSIIQKIIKDNKLENVYLIKKVPENELKYLVQRCHLGAVSYSKRDSNNKYCASGKIYEYLFEGLPVITTDNPPLLELVNKYKIGIGGDDFYSSIYKIKQNYKYYKKNVMNYIKKLNIKKENSYLANLIKERIKIIQEM